MTEFVPIAGFGTALALGGLISHAFHSWLRQRERERLNATDKAELLQRLDEVDSKIRELKNNMPSPRR